VQRTRAESATQEAVAQRQRATEQAQEAQHRLRELYVEQGRQEWLQGNAMQSGRPRHEYSQRSAARRRARSRAVASISTAGDGPGWHGLSPARGQ
jgi:hypothetical protein